jgi:small subunit ribosomal protein S9
MATKKIIKKEEEKIEVKKNNGEYFYAIGRRKTSVAKIKLFPTKESQNKVMVNGKKLEEYFSLIRLTDIVKSPLMLSGQDNNFLAEIKVSGGGINSQADAIKLGISRALVLFDGNLKKSLRDKGYLTRDPREVERKKAGLKKARRAPQWAKR